MNSPYSLQDLLKAELATDHAFGDVTAQLLGPAYQDSVRAVIKSREAGVFSGEAIVLALGDVFRDKIEFVLKVKEGQRIEKDTPLLEMTGPRGLLLSVERTALNFLGLSSGVASLTAQYVRRVEGSKAKVLATRKTTPGLREIQLQAVTAGGGQIHRRSLADGILIKENHVALSSEKALLENAHRVRSPLHGIEIEVQDQSSLNRVLESPFLPDVIMLDNWPQADLKRAVEEIRNRTQNRVRIEASGGVNLETISEIAKSGVDYVSVGRITHSATCLDLTLDFQV